MFLKRPSVITLSVLIVMFIAACGSSTTVANSCGSSGASANIGASDGLTFAPKSATITHGQSVCWQNNGSLAHTVT